MMRAAFELRCETLPTYCSECSGAIDPCPALPPPDLMVRVCGVSRSVEVKGTHIATIHGVAADFGPPPGAFGRLPVVWASPRKAETDITNTADMAGCIALIQRGTVPGNSGCNIFSCCCFLLRVRLP